MEVFDLRNKQSQIKDQGKRNTCVAFAGTAGHEYLKKNCLDLSEEYLYWGCKTIDGFGFDEGTTLYAAINFLKRHGQPLEIYLPYNSLTLSSAPNYSPSKEARLSAAQNKIGFGEKTDINIANIQQKLLEGFAVVAGIRLFDEFFIPQNGLISYPKVPRKDYGGHAILINGWDSRINNGVLIIRNSWGATWGEDGYGYLPYDYFTDFAIDSWCFKIS